MKLIVGLGNPGKEHTRHRHNIGFMILDRFAKQHGLSFEKKQSKAKMAEGKIEGRQIILAKPQTYMNLSGQSVQGLVFKYQLPLSEIMVVCDDLDLPLGKIRLRPAGGSAGHNGLKSIIGALGGQEFPRLRVGIGRPPPSPGANVPGHAELVSASRSLSPSGISSTIDFVLTEFIAEERESINEAIDRAGEALLLILQEGLQAAMNKYNQPLPGTEPR